MSFDLASFALLAALGLAATGALETAAAGALEAAATAASGAAAAGALSAAAAEALAAAAALLFLPPRCWRPRGFCLPAAGAFCWGLDRAAPETIWAAVGLDGGALAAAAAFALGAFCCAAGGAPRPPAPFFPPAPCFPPFLLLLLAGAAALALAAALRCSAAFAFAIMFVDPLSHGLLVGVAATNGLATLALVPFTPAAAGSAARGASVFCSDFSAAVAPLEDEVPLCTWLLNTKAALDWVTRGEWPPLSRPCLSTLGTPLRREPGPEALPRRSPPRWPGLGPRSLPLGPRRSPRSPPLLPRSLRPPLAPLREAP
mmetsp:Transcript_36472/g.87304  ORF Transcript_36472/g.87304 Transcript_36472/m.87304 type:complete len:315 (-) Transcript_36472:353-1297(-)